MISLEVQLRSHNLTISISQPVNGNGPIQPTHQPRSSLDHLCMHHSLPMVLQRVLIWL